MNGPSDKTPGDAGSDDSPPPVPPPSSQPPDLSIIARIVLLGVGWLLVLIGLVGLALPGLQGILTLLLGGALLSVASTTAHRFLHRLLHRWPAVWDRFESLRQKTHDALTRRHGPGDDSS